MKRILAMLLCAATVMTSLVFVGGAASVTNNAIKVVETDGMTGYSSAMDDINEKISSEGGVTVIMDVLVESTEVPDEGMFSQIAAFTGGGNTAKYNLLSYDFTAKQFKAGQSNNWISDGQSDYAAVQTNPFEWEVGRWYELAFRFNGNKAAIYLNGICVISTEFDSTEVDYLIVHPQFCTARFDNIRICDKTYSVADGVGEIWATEDFTDISAADESAVWYAADYDFITEGCNGVPTSVYDNCVRISDTDGSAGYSAAMDEFNEMVAANGGTTFIADVYVEAFTAAPEGCYSQIMAFTGAYGTDARYNYVGYNFGTGAFEARESASWVSDTQTLSKDVKSSDYALESGRWYEFAWQFDGNTAKMYVDGAEVLSASFSVVENSYIIFYPQYCDVKIDNIRLCDKDFDVVNGTGTVWTSEDFDAATVESVSDVWYFDSSYTLDFSGAMSAVIGDVNGDGVVNTTDLTTLRRALSSGSITLASGADVDASGSISTTDVTMLTRLLQGAKYGIDYSIDVTPITPDNSAIVDETEDPVDPPVEPDIPVDPEPDEPDEPVSNETFIDGLDGSTLKFNGKEATSYTFLLREGGVNNTDIALSFDVLVSEIDSEADFAGLGVWNGTNFVGYDFKDQAFVADTISYSYAPSTNTNTKLTLNVGEWNHFNFRRINNNTFHVYVNGVKQFEITGQSYADTFFLFGFKGCTAYVDNYQHYEAGTGKGLIGNFATFTSDGGYMLQSSDGACWLVGDQGFGGICTEVVAGTKTESGIAGTDAAAGDVITEPDTPVVPDEPLEDVDMGSGSGDTSGLDNSVLKFETSGTVSYSLLFSDQPQSYTDMALTFDVKIESIDTGVDFAGLGVWNGNGDEGRSSFVGFDFVDGRFTSDHNTFFPNAPAEDSHVKMSLQVGEWNHFCFRRLNNDTFEVYVNGKLCYTVTGFDYTNTYYIFAFKNCTAYVDNYQYYHSGIACGLVTDFTTGASTKDGMTIFSDGGYWLVGELSFAGVITKPDEAVEAVIAKISAIGTVTYNSLSAITAAETAYAALTDTQKAKVTNYSTLTSARSTYNALDAEVVAYKNAVAALPATATATDACKTAIANCATAYATLTSPGQVEAVATEKAKYDAFRAEWEKLLAAEDEAVAAVIAKISAIGTVTYNSLSAITAAETAYAALTDTQKAKVTNYSTLTSARSTYNALDAEVVAYKNAVAALPATATATDACKTAIANCATAYATLTSPGQVEAVATEKAKYDAFRAEWEKAVADAETPADVSMGSGTGDTSGIDGSALKFTASGTASYSLLFSDQPQSYSDMALTFDVKIESIDSGVDFAGLGVWSGNGEDNRSSFVGYDFVDKRFTSDHNTFFPSAPTADSNITMNLQVGEWNHFCFRRLNNNTFEVYVNGKLCYTVTGFDYTNTYYIFAFKNCTAYVDNYQYYHAGTACGLVTDFTTGATTDANGDTRFSDGGYWVVGSLSYAGVVKGEPGFDGSVLKFNGNTATSYTLVLNEGPISNTDVALTFDVFVESINSEANFAGIGLWNGDNTFIGYDYKDQKFTAQKGLGYPYPADNDNGGSLALKVGEWNHFVFRRLNNTSIVVFVNGVKCAEITGLSFSDTYMICGFKNCIAYIDNYQAYENGVGKGLYTDFSQFTKRSDGALISPDGGYWIVGTQGFDSIYTTKTGGGATGSGLAGTNKVPGSSAIDGVGRINLDSGNTGGDSGNTGGDSGNTGGDSGSTTPTTAIGESVDYSTQCTTGWELANRAANIAKYYKTLYIMGCFGAPMTAKNKTRYTQNHSYNMSASRTAMINAASSDTFGFDCVCLIKGILWGWSGKLNTNYGGASYTSNGVPDFGSDATSAYVNNTRSTDWSNIAIGEAVWMSGHIGIYIGDGLAVECTPKWENDVQITAVGNIGTKAGYNTRTWTAHGKLKYVTYS